MKPVWANSSKTYVWLFNTGRGLSVCIRMPGNCLITYDLGCSEAFSPIEFCRKELFPHAAKDGKSSELSQLILSHPHVDHIQEAKQVNECTDFSLGLVTAPNDTGENEFEDENVDFNRIENSNNAEQIKEYKRLYAGRNPPLMTLEPGRCPDINGEVVCGLYYLKAPLVGALHPSNDHHYANGLSLCFYYRHNRHSMWLCGDVTPEVHKEILLCSEGVEKRMTTFGCTNGQQPDSYYYCTSDQPSPSELFKNHGLDLLVAPHHGLESCFSSDLFESLDDGKTTVNVISEKRHIGENDGIVDPRYSGELYTRGVYADIDGREQHRRMVSTRNGHHILMILGHDSPRPKVFLRKNANDLLNLK